MIAGIIISTSNLNALVHLIPSLRGKEAISDVA